jgi:hypothetical protein
VDSRSLADRSIRSSRGDGLLRCLGGKGYCAERYTELSVMSEWVVGAISPARTFVYIAGDKEGIYAGRSQR